MIKNLDPSYRFSIYIQSETCFTDSKLTELLKVLQNRSIKRIAIPNQCLSKDQTKIVLEFLHSPEARYGSFVLQFEDPEDVTIALKAVENRCSFKYAEIKTKDLISAEAEELACSIINTHTGCLLELNSNVKLIMPMKKRGIRKYHYQC